jgi:hypothetical protein
MFGAGFAAAQPAAEVQGTAKDVSGSAVTGAVVTLEDSSATGPRTALTDQAGAFHFYSVAPGTYTVTVAALGFEVWRAGGVAVTANDHPPPLSVTLQVAAASSFINVVLPQHELAADQLKAEEKQRVLGIFPDFFVSYEANPVPLTAAQKFQLGWRTITDPVAYITTAIAAGIQQGRNNYPEFGQGVEGYAKRFGAQYANRVTSVVIERVVMQSIFRQDPRYFYKGTGSVGARALYAIGMAFVRKGDNGHWQPDYTDVLGGLAAGEISTLYYPSSSRPVRRLFDNVALGFSGRAARNLLHEFVFRQVTTHVPKSAAGVTPRTLPEGTEVSLISVEDWSSKTPENGQVAFMLTRDLQVDGVVVAPIGTKAWGHATVVGNTMQVRLDHVRLKAGDAEVPLRSTPLRDGGEALEYHRLENSGRIAVNMYVAGSVTLSAAR